MIPERKAAIELSIGTVVIIVLAMSMLILGLVLVRSIFRGATESVDDLNSKVKAQITSLFADTDAKVAVLLGNDKTARIKAGSESFGIGIGAKTPDGASAGSARGSRLKYKLSFQQDQNFRNCAHATMLGLQATKNLMTEPLDTTLDFDQFEGSNAFALITLKIPEGTKLCSQKVFIDIYDTQATTPNEAYTRAFFVFEVTEAGFFS